MLNLNVYLIAVCLGRGHIEIANSQEICKKFFWNKNCALSSPSDSLQINFYLSVSLPGMIPHRNDSLANFVWRALNDNAFHDKERTWNVSRL